MRSLSCALFLLGASSRLATARVHPYLYGVPKADGVDLDDDNAQLLAASNTTASNGEDCNLQSSLSQ